MKERGIIFSAPMVRALLAGNKTQTRRVVRAPRGYELPVDPTPAELEDIARASPFGLPGDRLWVRETWRPVKCGRPGCAAHANGVEYRATAEVMAENPIWKSPIYMTRVSSRITLDVAAVRVERLQAITNGDARAEGIGGCGPGGYCSCDVDRYARLWDEINGKRAPWAANPFVWVVTFRRVACHI